MRIISIIGARPQFIKASAISRAIRTYNKSTTDSINETIIHTGQHFDKNMSKVFFNELEIPEPDYNLEISGLKHGAMTGRMLEKIENILEEIQPNAVLIYGDTNSTLAGALAASKLHIPIAHIEAGLRSFNMNMPEEINRIISDRISTLLFCPTEEAIKNLHAEAVNSGTHLVGDVMYDAVKFYGEKAKNDIDLDKWDLTNKEYVLCTIHRAENTNDSLRLVSILDALQEITRQCKIILPLHPRTRQLINTYGINEKLNDLNIIEPVSYLEMLRLEDSALAILTDSGGVQKEAFFNKVPCITLRDETEWVETVQLGWNQVVGTDKEKILASFNGIPHWQTQTGMEPYGNGTAAEKILNIMR